MPDVERAAGVFWLLRMLWYPSVLLSDYAILSFVFILHGEMFSFVLYSDLNHGAELIISVRIC